MQYSDDEYAPEVGDVVEYRYENYPPDRATVTAVGKNRIQIAYENQNIKPRSEWVDPSRCDMISRES